MLGVLAAYLLVCTRMAFAEERTHLIEYGVLVTLIKEALTERASQGRRVSMPALLAVLATAFVGPLDESIQTFLPTRFFDYRDVLLNVLAALMAIAASMVLACARQWRSQG